MSEPQYHLEGVVRTRTEEMEDFEGPLDVIFLLLSKNKIEIQDVSITAILEQYLAYLEEMKRLDMEIASEFITMASHLMLIKTKMLLSAAEQAEAESELDLLRQSLPPPCLVTTHLSKIKEQKTPCSFVIIQSFMPTLYQ